MNQEVLDYNKTDIEILAKKILDCRKVLVRSKKLYGNNTGFYGITYILINDDFSTVIITGLIGYTQNIIWRHTTEFAKISGKPYQEICDDIIKNKFEYITDYCK